VRHAQPTKIAVILAYEIDSVTLIIEDCGLGFVKTAGVRGLGLRAMEKRALSISASFAIDSRPGKGTLVKIVAPLSPQTGLSTLPVQICKQMLKSSVGACANTSTILKSKLSLAGRYGTRR
jgi:hypothetical protein